MMHDGYPKRPTLLPFLGQSPTRPPFDKVPLIQTHWKADMGQVLGGPNQVETQAKKARVWPV